MHRKKVDALTVIFGQRLRFLHRAVLGAAGLLEEVIASNDGQSDLRLAGACPD